MTIETMSGGMLRQCLEIISGELQHGLISYDEAKTKAQPYLDEINMRGQKIAKEFKKKFYPITFGYVTR